MADEVKPTAEATATPAEKQNEVPAAQEQPKDSTAEPRPADAPKEAPPADSTPAEGKKDEAPAPPSEPVEVKYDLKLKDGSFLDAKDVEQVLAKAKELKLSPEQAQALLDEKDEARLSFAKQQSETLKARSVEWAEAVKKDPELGGDGFNENVETAKRFVQKFGSDAFRKALDDTGLGNHPELIRTFARAGKALMDDKFHFASAKGSAPEKKELADMLYGGTKK